ncbi:MAG: TetR/AcrR family transcriptional regulator [Methanobacterium paludis]|nr:TetR/AcrR family transcriptional regulator [Methanobacterium paludis]
MDDKISTKDRILETATRLFQLQGYHATGLNQILKESNAPKGSLYYHFPNGKEELALESINLTKVFVEKTIRERLAKIDDPAESIKNSIEEMVSNLNSEKDEKLSIKSTKKVSVNLIALETSSTNETLRKACESTFNTWQNLYTEKLVYGGFSREKAEALGMVIESMVEGAIIMSLTTKSDAPLLKVAEQIPHILNH